MVTANWRGCDAAFGEVLQTNGRLCHRAGLGVACRYAPSVRPAAAQAEPPRLGVACLRHYNGHPVVRCSSVRFSAGLEAELLEDTPGALWSHRSIEASRLRSSSEAEKAALFRANAERIYRL